MAQPFINPNYFAQPGYQSYQNYYQQPYQQMVAQNRLNQLEQQYPQFAQQPQPQQQALGLSGKIVDSIEVVKATDVPMDGNMYYFPKADGTEIFVKRWLANGTTKILAFKPCFDGETGNSTKNTAESRESANTGFTEAFENVASQLISSLDGRFDAINGKFDAINSRFDDIEKKLTKGGAGK